MTCRIAVVTDVHYRLDQGAMAVRLGHLATELLSRTVDQLNQTVKPDVTVVLGDLVDVPDDPNAPALLSTLRGILEELDAPWLAIPGNHDPGDRFFEVFERVDCKDINGVRLVAFVDPERPGHNACRDDEGMQRMARLAGDHRGPLVALQHVPVGTPRVETPYGYTNFDDVAAAMRDHGYTLALSGHYHAGAPLQQCEGFSTMVIPALCEAPCRYALVTVDGGAISAEVLSHQWPAAE